MKFLFRKYEDRKSNINCVIYDFILFLLFLSLIIIFQGCHPLKWSDRVKIEKITPENGQKKIERWYYKDGQLKNYDVQYESK